ncbi:MAG: hypothetical protein ACLFNT_09720 [Spirochaetales bacterium]
MACGTIQFGNGEIMRSPWTSRVVWDVPVASVQTSSGRARELTFDLYLPTRDASHPAGADAAPVVIYVHGGGWEEGSNDRPPGFRSILKRGFALAAVQYRLATEGTADGRPLFSTPWPPHRKHTQPTGPR